MTGKIVKAISGFYYIEFEYKIYECRAKGILKKNNISPMVGDNAEFEEIGENSYVLKSLTKPLAFEDIDTITRNNVIDNDYITYYEYSRITTKQNVKYTQDINLDNEEAECAIILFGDNDKFSSVKIDSSQSSLILKDVLISQDSGATFQTCFGSNPLNINNMH